MSTNQVYVFSKPQPATYTYSSEIRSSVEKGSKQSSTLYIKMLSKVDRVSAGHPIHASLPYIKQDIPIVVVFRALGFVADRDILEHICYDETDQQMYEMLKPCIEEAFVIQEQQVGALGSPVHCSLPVCLSIGCTRFHWEARHHRWRDAG